MSRSEDHPDNALLLSSLFEEIRPLLAGQQQPVYLVGGAVRDAIMGRASQDLDFVVPSDAIKLAFLVGDQIGAPAYVMDRDRDIGRVVLGDPQTTLDFARIRGRNIKEDLRARDFTINALAIPANTVAIDDIIDVVGGRSDINSCSIRATHEGAVVEDPVRAMRGVRLAAQLNFDVTDETLNAIRGAAPLLVQVSNERIRDELVKMLSVDDPGNALEQLEELGLLEQVLPEISILKKVDQSAPHFEDVLAHSGRVLTCLSSLVKVILSGKTVSAPSLEMIRIRLDPYSAELTAHLERDVSGALVGANLLMLAALFHDSGKAQTSQVDEKVGRIRFLQHEQIGARLGQEAMNRLRFSNEAIAHVKQVVAAHMRPLWLSQVPNVSGRAIYRFYRDTSMAGIDVCLLALADELALHKADSSAQVVNRRFTDLTEVVERLISNYFRRYQASARPAPLVDGRELIDVLGLQEGREVGRLIRILEEAQAIGEITTRDEAIALAKKRRQ